MLSGKWLERTGPEEQWIKRNEVRVKTFVMLWKTAYEGFRERKKELLGVVFAFLGVYALMWMLPIGEKSIAFSNSIFSAAVFFVLYFLIRKILAFPFEGGKKGWFFPGLFGMSFSFCMTAGVQLDLYGSVPFTNGFMWLGILSGTLAVGLIVRYFFELLKNIPQKQRKKERVSLKSWLFFSAVIFCLYLPVFLAVYPGFFVYDAQDELLQVVTRNFSTHHPLFHVLLLGGVIQAVYKVSGSYNAGIACYTILQMLVLSGIFGFCVYELKKRGKGRSFCVLSTLYFGLCPVLVMFSLCSAKDGLFAGMLLVMTIELMGLLKEPEKIFQNKGRLALFLAAALLMMLLRHNGFYAFLVFAVILVWVQRKHWKKWVPCLILPMAVYLLLSAGLTAFLQADASENQELLTVPIMQLSRVYADKEEELPLEEKELLYQYLPREALLRYTPKVSDGVKLSFLNEAYEADAGSFFKLWISWGVKNPLTYLNAWFMTSYGFWYPDTVIDVYRGNTVFTYTYGDSSYFGYEVEQPGTRQSKLPWLDEIYRKLSLEVYQQKVPVISMLFSPGALFWVLAFFMSFWCYAGKRHKVLSFLPVFLCWLTVLLGPTYLVRYVVYLWAVLPLLLAESQS